MTTTTTTGAVTETELVRALERADIHDLVRAIDPGYGRGMHGPSGFVCPTCNGWSARVLDSLRWECTGACDDPYDDPDAFTSRWRPTTTTAAQRTVLELRRLVAESYSFAFRLVREVRPSGRGTS